MKYTDKEYYMEQKLVQKIDLMIKRMDKRYKFDNLILIDGDEGYGKSNLEVAIAYYVSQKTGREFGLKNVFFDLDKLIDFAVSTEAQIICWDEGALGGLASEWWNKNQRKFIKLLMVARKKRHFFIICIPKFFKLNEYIVLDRAVALIHVYAREELNRGRFVYYNKKAKEKLFYDWRKSKFRTYKKHYSFHGSFPEVLPIILSEKEYEKKKDEAIMGVGTEEKKKVNEEVIRLKFLISQLSKSKKLLTKEIAEHFNINPKTVWEWSNFSKQHPELLAIEV